MHSATLRTLIEERVPVGLLAVALWLCATLGVVWGVPQARRNAELRSSVAEYDTVLATSGGHTILIERLTLAEDSLNATLERMSGGMARASDLSGLLQMLIERARAADIGFVNVRPQAQGKDDAAGAYPVLLEFTTSYHSLGRFVAGIEAQPNLARIERMAVSAQSARALEARLLLTVLLQPGAEGQP